MPYKLIDEYTIMIKFLNDNLIVNDLWLVNNILNKFLEKI